MKRSTALLFTPAIIVFMLFAIVAAADTLQLRDGKQIAGKLVRAANSKIFFRGDDGKERSYNFTDVSSLTFGAGVVASAAATTVTEMPAPIPETATRTTPVPE